MRTLLETSAILFAAMLITSCTPMVTEWADSSGCMFTSGGPGGVTFGSVTVCRSGKDGAAVYYADKERTIAIQHERP